MSELSTVISDTVSDQNEISEFLQNPEIPQEAAPVAASAETGEAEAASPVKRGRGRPKGSGKHQKSAARKAAQKSFIPPEAMTAEEFSAAPSPDEAAAAAEALQRKNAAAAAAVLIQTTGMMLAGDEGKMQREEFSAVSESFDRFFEVKGINDFPPGISLGLALGGYYVRVLTTEKTRPKLALFFSWVKSKIATLRKKPAAAAQNGA